MTERFYQFLEYPIWVFACLGFTVGFGVPMIAYTLFGYLL